MKLISNFVGSLIVAGFAAGFAVHQAVVANANINNGLTEAAVLFALALGLQLFALRATMFPANSGGHESNVVRQHASQEMTEVM